MTKSQNRNAATAPAAAILVIVLAACGGGASSDLESGQKIANKASPDRSVALDSGGTLAISATANTRGPGIASHRWSIAAKSDSALRAKAPTIQNADCANATTSSKPIAGGAITIAQSRCDASIVVPVSAVDASWRVTSTATGTDKTTSSDSFDLQVRAVPLPAFELHASASANPALDQAVHLYGSAKTEPASAAIKYSWSQLAGPTVTLAGADSSDASFVPTLAGEYVFLLTGTWEIDDLLRVKKDSVHLRVAGFQASDFGFDLKAAAAPQSVPSGNTVTLSAAVSTKAGAAYDSISYKWTKLFGLDSASTATNLSSVILAPELAGKYVWSVEATLKSGSYTETRVAHAAFEVLAAPSSKALPPVHLQP